MKAVGVLMKELTTSRRKFHERGRDESFDGKLEKLWLVLNNIKDVFVVVKKNEEKLLDTLAEVYNHLHRLDRKKLDEDMKHICKRIRDSADNLLSKDASDELSKEEDHKGGKIYHSLEELVQPHLNEIWTEKDFNQLGYPLKPCLFCLLIFPENAVIRKRIAINMWIAEGLVRNTEKKTAEEKGEDVIDDLLKFKLKLYLDGDSEYIRPSRLLLDRKKVIVGGVDTKNVTLRNIYNIGSSYLNFGPQWGTDAWKDLKVLQLGRWQDSSLHHIEVGSQEFLRELRTLKQLKYLSLRGISNIFELPSSITGLERLLILDLKACHNLERLPDDISSMKSLTHLIMSDCCLLEGMPKGIEKLTNLQVLKGFLISTSPCRISDLAKNLRKLRRLSIRIGSEAVIKDWEFSSLGTLSALKHLKISWSVSDPRYSKIGVILPISLTKLHLECFPGKSFEECFALPNLMPCELNITGGKLESMIPQDLLWKQEDLLRNVEILRLKYLKQLNVDINNLKEWFPALKYVEIK
ncbi:hypothetical protein V8G54_021954 [Vigna mungo]|uniref:Disease resistance RPP13-like protein 4 n=1 Tax=Vigna mungo TaxID=3915 RepID=A0AAQ3NH33_VIGMU